MHYPRDKGLKVHSEGVGLKNALPRRWGLKGALKRKKKKKGHEGKLSER